MIKILHFHMVSVTGSLLLELTWLMNGTLRIVIATSLCLVTTGAASGPVMNGMKREVLMRDKPTQGELGWWRGRERLITEIIKKTGWSRPKAMRFITRVGIDEAKRQVGLSSAYIGRDGDGKLIFLDTLKI